jgi:hypothetical protein
VIEEETERIRQEQSQFDVENIQENIVMVEQQEIRNEYIKISRLAVIDHRIEEETPEDMMELEQEEELNAMMSKQQHSGHIEHKNMAETSSSSSTSLQMTPFSDQADSINEKPNGTTIVAMDNASKETNKADIGNLVIGY